MGVKSLLVILVFLLSVSLVSATSGVCGNGYVEANEACDDGNTYNDDGCDASCYVESNYRCAHEPSVCVYENPSLPNSCGLDIVLIMDSSFSIEEHELNQVKSAFKGFVDELLPYTPSEIAVVDFDYTARLTSDYTTDVAALHNAIDSASTGGYTNWEDALEEAHDQYDGDADVYIFASDGNPNHYGDKPYNVQTEDAVREAIKDANEIKKDGVRIISLGIGEIFNEQFMIDISSEDAFYKSNFDTLANDLSSIATELCGGTISVRKLVDNYPAQNWKFTLDAYGTQYEAYTNTQGYAEFSFDITDDTVVSVTEYDYDGYETLNAFCTENNNAVGHYDGDYSVKDINVKKNSIIYCQFHNTAVDMCGDGDVQHPEQCDDSNTNSGDGCSSTCRVEFCGDDIVQSGLGEQCDDGNSVSGDGCSKFCQIENGPVCGNELLEAGETCDDGNTVSGDGCSSSCQLENGAVCGNGVQETGEQCDDGNLNNNDGCNQLCQIENGPTCGNNIIETGETCDDGNTVSGDGCSSTCFTETTGGDFTVRIEADSLTGRLPHTTNFDAVVSGGQGPFVFQWDFNNDGIFDSAEQSPTAEFNKFGTFIVSVLATDSDGRTARDTIVVSITDQRKRTKVHINSISFYEEYVKPGDTLEAYVNYENLGEENLKDVRVKAIIQELGVRSVTANSDPNTREQVSKLLEIEIPNDAEKGRYWVQFVIDIDTDRRIKFRPIDIV